MKVFFYILLAFLLFTQCHRDMYTHQMLWDCHTQTSLTMDSTERLLVGSWHWIDGDCNIFNFGVPSQRVFDPHVSLHFDSDQTYVMRRANQLVRAGTWTLSKPPNGELYLLDATEPEHSRLLVTGFILFCEDRLEINGSYRGDCDQFYRRVY